MLIALATRGSGMALQFLTSLVLVRVLGAEGVGIYSVYLAWVMVISGGISLGAPTLALRRVSVLSEHNGAKISAFVVRLLVLCLMTGGLTLGGVVAFRDGLAGRLLGEDVHSQLIVMVAVGAIIFTFMKVGSESLKGLGKVNQSIGFENILMPLLVILLALCLMITPWSISSYEFVFAHLLIMVLVAVALLAYLGRHAGWQRPTREGLGVDLRELMPLWGNLMIAMLFLNLPMIMAPGFAGYDEVGIFSIAYKLIMITVNVLMVLASFFGPRFAKAYAANDAVELKKALNQSRIASMLLFLPVFILFLALPEWVMGLFGEAFRAGAGHLVVMVSGQLIYASTGLVGLFLIMTHRAELELKIAIVAIVIMAALIFVLGYFFGIDGVAWGFAAGLAFKNMLSLYFVFRHQAKPLGNTSL